MSKPVSFIRAEAALLIRTCIEQGKVLAAEEYAAALVERHPNLRGDDANWYRAAAYGWARFVVRDVLRGFGRDPDDEAIPEQLALAGFAHVQIAYDIPREGRWLIVPTAQMTAEECFAKAAYLRKQGDGIYAHAEELEVLGQRKLRGEV